MNRRSITGIAAGALVAAMVAAAGCGGGSAGLTELQRVRSGGLDVVVLSPRGGLRHGKDDFVIEFRSEDGSLVDVGAVRANASMPMPGMPMFASVTVQRADVPVTGPAKIERLEGMILHFPDRGRTHQESVLIVVPTSSVEVGVKA